MRITTKIQFYDFEINSALVTLQSVRVAPSKCLGGSCTPSSSITPGGGGG